MCRKEVGRWRGQLHPESDVHAAVARLEAANCIQIAMNPMSTPHNRQASSNVNRTGKRSTKGGWGDAEYEHIPTRIKRTWGFGASATTGSVITA